MSIDLRTVAITPLRNTFDHIASRFGDKPASRYQEGSYRLQAENNFHYRPTWAPHYEIFDKHRSALVMDDWYSFKDPRQFYYGTYTLNRARMQETAEGAFSFVEQRGLADTFDPEAKALALEILLPLRHVAWGSNTNNAFISAYGYGTTFTQPCLYQAMDQLGIAQYLTRLGLLVGGVGSVAVARVAWMDDPKWQGVRRLVEDMFVVEDPFELFVAQNFAFDGLLYPLVYRNFDAAIIAKGGPTISMLLRFQEDWFTETSKWVDAFMTTASTESSQNSKLVAGWVTDWVARSADALEAVADAALDQGAAALAPIRDALSERAAKCGAGQ